MQTLSGKIAIITGAGSGIGRATAQLFATRGARLVLADLNGPAVAAVAHQINEEGGQAVALAGDAADAAHVQALVDTCVREHGVPNVLFANAGIASAASLMDETIDDWQQIFRVNVLGPVTALRAVAPLMAKHGGGSVVLTASVAGLRSGAGSAAYSASKAAVISLAQTAGCQLAVSKIRVNAICPGLIETGMTKFLFDQARIVGKMDRIGKFSPMQRAAQPQEIATMAAFLASDDASFITGQAFPVDGGLTATHPFTPGRTI